MGSSQQFMGSSQGAQTQLTAARRQLARSSGSFEHQPATVLRLHCCDSPAHTTAKCMHSQHVGGVDLQADGLL